MNQKKRGLTLLLAICLLSSLIIPSAAEAAPEPEPLPSWCYGMLADGYAVGLFGDEIAGYPWTAGNTGAGGCHGPGGGG